MVTALFRCPSSEIDFTNETPKVCKPYIEAKSYLVPQVKPFYDAYASPYVEIARPYATEFNQHVYNPLISFGTQAYQAYGALPLSKIRKYSDERWAKTVKPKIDVAQLQAIRQYNLNVAPHLSKASAASRPYYNAVKDNMLQIYHEQIHPAYISSRPFAEKTYNYVYNIAVESVFPHVKSAWTSMIIFVDRTLWPWLRVLYGENVEPQLFRISERLGRYRDGRKFKAAVDDVVR